MSRKRDKPYPSLHVHTSVAKRRRPLPPVQSSAEDDDMDKPLPKPAPPPALVVVDLPSHCSVLDLKSRFEIYGSISRIRIDRDCVGYITYRTKDSADAAMAAALDPSFGFTIDSKKVPFLIFMYQIVAHSLNILVEWRFLCKFWLFFLLFATLLSFLN